MFPHEIGAHRLRQIEVGGGEWDFAVLLLYFAGGELAGEVVVGALAPCRTPEATGGCERVHVPRDAERVGAEGEQKTALGQSRGPKGATIDAHGNKPFSGNRRAPRST
jgi:hypothetical protein